MRFSLFAATRLRRMQGINTRCGLIECSVKITWESGYTWLSFVQLCYNVHPAAYTLLPSPTNLSQVWYSNAAIPRYFLVFSLSNNVM